MEWWRIESRYIFGKGPDLDPSIIPTVNAQYFGKGSDLNPLIVPTVTTQYVGKGPDLNPTIIPTITTQYFALICSCCHHWLLFRYLLFFCA